MRDVLSFGPERLRWVPIAAATLLLLLILTTISPVILAVSNVQSILVQASVTAIMAIGMTFIILTAGIDISVGAILFFTSALFATLMQATGNYPLCFAAAIGCATLLGALNGVLIIRFNISPLITTLATYSIYRGAAIHLTGAQNVPVPREMGFLGNGRILGIPVPILILGVAFVLAVYLLTSTRFGVYCRAIGNSARSAAESSLPVGRVLIGAYALGGFLSGIAALILLARVGGLQSGIGIGIEFTVIAAAILGGTKLTGGTGTVAGSVIGAVFLVLIDNGLNLMIRIALRLRHRARRDPDRRRHRRPHGNAAPQTRHRDRPTHPADRSGSRKMTAGARTRAE